MLPKAHRIVKRADFDTLFQFGRVRNDALVRIVYKSGEGRAAVVAAKSLGSIARRNAIRRRWRDALGKLGAEPLDKLDMVIVLKPGAESLRGDKIEKFLLEVLEGMKA